jgi:CRP/FNR family transcriptional regulator
MSPVTAHEPDVNTYLSNIPLFSTALSTADRHAIAVLFGCTVYAKDAIIFYEQDFSAQAGARIYFVAQGCAKLVKYSREGESTIVRLASVGEFFGVTGAFTGKPTPFSAEALTDTVILHLAPAAFRTLLGRHPDLAVGMICALGEVLWFNYATHNQVVKKSDARVAKIILHHYYRNGVEAVSAGMQLNIPLPHEYIASMTGIAYEESVRIISRLRKQHQCIHYLRGGKIQVTNLDVLRHIAQEEATPAVSDYDYP